MTFGNKVDLKQALHHEHKLKNIHASKQMEVIPLIKLDPKSKDLKIVKPKEESDPLRRVQTEDNSAIVKEL